MPNDPRLSELARQEALMLTEPEYEDEPEYDDDPYHADNDPEWGQRKGE